MRSSQPPRPRSSDSELSRVEAYSRLAGVYDEIVVDPCHGSWASYLHELWGADPDRVGSVLDLCCGTGLLAAELGLLGYRVVGVDASEVMLLVARRRLGAEASLIRTSLPELPVEGVFDAAVSSFDGLNYLPPESFRRTISAVAGRLRRGGWLVFDLHTDAMMSFTVANPVVAGRSAGREFTIASAVDVRARTCDTTIELAETLTGEPFSEHHRQYFHSDTDVHDALAGTGFAVGAVTDEYTSRPADATTLRATWISRLV